MKDKVLKSLERRKNEIYAEMQNRLNDVERKIMKINKGEYSLWGKTPRKNRKPLLDMGICLFEVNGEGGDVASWDVEK